MFKRSTSTLKKVLHFRLSFKFFYLPSITVEQPRIISVRCRPARKGCPVPEIDPYFPKDETPESIVITRDINGESLRFPLHLWYSDMSLRRGHPVNCAICNIATGAAKRRWCGPAVVLKFADARRANYAEAGSNELPVLSAYFLGASDSALVSNSESLSSPVPSAAVTGIDEPNNAAPTIADEEDSSSSRMLAISLCFRTRLY
jgi:hypothetical protein